MFASPLFFVLRREPSVHGVAQPVSKFAGGELKEWSEVMAIFFYNRAELLVLFGGSFCTGSVQSGEGEVRGLCNGRNVVFLCCDVVVLSVHGSSLRELYNMRNIKVCVV
jgi:hypothetical protein